MSSVVGSFSQFLRKWNGVARAGYSIIDGVILKMEDLKNEELSGLCNDQIQIHTGDDSVLLNEGAVATERKEYKCQICLDFVSNDELYELSNCRHKFCRNCLIGYLISKILNGCTNPTCCFVSSLEPTSESHSANVSSTNQYPMCSIAIAEEDIVSILDKEQNMMDKYQRFKYFKENINARECPLCLKIVDCDPLNSNKVTCPHCDKIFCFKHSNAHNFDTHPTCELYEAYIEKEIEASVNLIVAESKPCPICQMPVMKLGMAVPKPTSYIIVY